MSKLETNTIDNISGSTTLTIGDSNTSTIALKSGATLTNFPANTPAFNASLSSDQSLSHNTQTVIQFDSELYDVGGCYNNTGSTVTLNGISTPAYAFAPNVAGKYFFHGSVYILNSSSGADLILASGIFQNGTATYQNNSRYDTDGASGVTASGTIDMNGTSDYIQFFGAQRNITSESGSRSTRGNNSGRIFTYFTAYKLIGA